MEEIVVINNKNDMIRLAKKYAKLFKPGDLIALYGNLGVGKTYFVQKTCKALNVTEDVSSPSYVLLNEYSGIYPINHYDLYRLQFTDEVYELGILEHLSQSITFIEWPEIAEQILPKHTYHFYFDYLENNKRKVVVKHTLGV